MEAMDIKRSASSNSTLSCITVDNDALDISLGSSSTPPTSVNDAGSIGSATAPKDMDSNEKTVRARRPRLSTVNYNENALAGTARTPIRRKEVKTPKDSKDTIGLKMTREVQQLMEDSIQVLNLDWSVDAMPGDKILASGTAKMQKSRLGLDKDMITNATNAIQRTASVLGKRSRDAMDAGLNKLQDLSRRKSLRPRVSAVAEATQAVEATPSKKAKISTEAKEDNKGISTSARKPVAKPRVKRWLSQGLYVGQDPDFDPRLTNARNEQKKAKSNKEPARQREYMPMPMFAGKRALENGRDFRLPFDVFSPLPPGQPKPEEWRKTQKNVFVGDAGDLWKKTKKLEHSACICTPETGCDEDCYNRFMLYECDSNNCNVGPEFCKNRSFEDLRKRCKKGGKYNVGVEVIKTEDRGYGVRSNRTFEPNQIIVEYTGEIVTQDECDDRMRKRYKNNECFYLMVFDQNMIIDATRGSIARFVNHSCEPNCKMEKWIVAGKPRMALFAGERGIMTGEELTYDYNFDPFSTKNIQVCRCATPSCRGVLGPRPKEREIKDALKPLTSPSAAGTKRKLQTALSSSFDNPSSSVTKRRKLAVPATMSRKVGKAVRSVGQAAGARGKTQVARAKVQVVKVKKVSDEQVAKAARAARMVRRARTQAVMRKGLRVREEKDEGEKKGSGLGRVKVEGRTGSRGGASRGSSSGGGVGTIRVDSRSVRRGVVRTIKGKGKGSRGMGKSIRVIEAEKEGMEEETVEE